MTQVATLKRNELFKVDASGLQHRELNTLLRKALAEGAKRIDIHNVYGQRYIGTDLEGTVSINIYGTPGNDLGAFMNGPTISVFGNAQDGSGNTMNEGEIVIHGRAGDITGLSARGGKIFVKGDVGYRTGIHMKEYQNKKPAIIIGGTVQDFTGEYMAGGTLVILGLSLPAGEAHRSHFLGTGMHSGTIYLRGDIEKYQLGKEVGTAELSPEDRLVLEEMVYGFASRFQMSTEAILAGKFTKLFPLYLRPYGRLYAA